MPLFSILNDKISVSTLHGQLYRTLGEFITRNLDGTLEAEPHSSTSEYNTTVINSPGASWRTNLTRVRSF